MTVQNFMKIVWTVFEKFEISMKGEKKKQKNDTIAQVVENCFRLLKTDFALRN